MKDKKTCLKIINIVSKYYNRDILDAKTLTNRKRENVMPRQIAMYLIDKYVKTDLQYNADFFKKDHATVIHAKKTINNLLEYNRDVVNQIREIENIITLTIDFGKLEQKEQLIFRIAEKLRKKSIERVYNINKILSY